jgi:hypothetical protein
VSIGSMVRRAFGNNFRPVGEAYRSIFVNMGKVTDHMIRHIPHGAHVLDIGGGDGFVVNMLLEKRPDIRVTMTDLAPSIGTFIDAHNLNRAVLLPATDFSQVDGDYQVVTLTDVVHHVPTHQRTGFFTALARACRGRSLLVKDVQPGGPKARLALWSDLYITGDKGVSFLSVDELIGQVRAAFGNVRAEVAMPDFPNYVVTFLPPLEPAPSASRG